MDQDLSPYSRSLSTPKIVSPGNNDWFEGEAVSISGTADRAVPIRIWDWLSPVATTFADGDGYWSITLHDVEIGDHMYCAEAYWDSPARSARSPVVAVRIVSPTHSSVASSSHTPRRWKLSSTGFRHRFVGRRRSDSRADATRQVEPEAEREPPGGIQDPIPGSLSAGDPYSGVPSAEDAPVHQLPSAVALMPLDSEPEPAPVAKQPPIDVSAYRIVDEPQAIEAPAQVLLMLLGPVELGTADEVLDLVPAIDATTHLLPVPVAPERIWTERVPVEPAPTTRAIDRGG